MRVKGSPADVEMLLTAYRPHYARARAYCLTLFDKFTNDWGMNLVAMVAFNVFTSIVPLLLALVVVLTFIPVQSHNVLAVSGQINRILPSNVRSQANVAQWLRSIHQASGLLALLSIGGVLWGGTVLFGAIENAFAIVYREKTRDFVPQKLMCLLMLAAFVILLPLSFAASLVLSAATTTLGRILPSGMSGAFTAGVGAGGAFLALLILFLAIYIVVPNRPIAWRFAWRGALFAAVILWIINTAFPFYAAHFIGTREYSSAAVVAVIVAITWIWLFAIVLLIGAQINAISLGIGPWNYDISRVLMAHRREDERPLPPVLRQHRQHASLPFSGILRDSLSLHTSSHETDEQQDERSQHRS